MKLPSHFVALRSRSTIGTPRQWLLPLAMLVMVFFVIGTAESFSIPNRPPVASPSLPVGDEQQQQRFPSPETPPAEVLQAHLEALRGGDLPNVYHLFSRARKLEIDTAARKDTRESEPSPRRREQAVVAFLRHRGSDSLLSLPSEDDDDDDKNPCATTDGNNRYNYQILSLLGDPDPGRGRLLTRLARIKANSGYYMVTLTRQSDWDGKGDPRDCDGYERCWFVWDIRREESDDGEEEEDDDPLPQGGIGKPLSMVA